MKKSKILAVIKNILISCCMLFSIIILIYAALVSLLSNGFGLNPRSVLFLFAFSCSVVSANRVLEYKKTNAFFKVFIHFIIVTIATIIFIYIPHGKSISPSNAMILFLCYCVLYFMCFIVCNAIKKSKKKRDKKTEYKNVYDRAI